MNIDDNIKVNQQQREISQGNDQEKNILRPICQSK